MFYFERKIFQIATIVHVGLGFKMHVLVKWQGKACFLLPWQPEPVDADGARVCAGARVVREQTALHCISSTINAVHCCCVTVHRVFGCMCFQDHSLMFLTFFLFGKWEFLRLGQISFHL